MPVPGCPPDIGCLCLDVDGVLTSGHVFFDDAGRGGRKFHVHDGFAMRCFMDLGGTIVICSGKESAAVAARMAELGVTHVLQGSRDKLADVQACLAPLGITLAQTAMVGDDLPDLTLMRRCGFPVAVANAAPEVKAAARLVTERCGGEGAVREVIEHILRASGRWAEVVRRWDVGSTSG